MPKLSHRVPQLSRHVRGGAFVKIAGQQVWLGRYDDPLTQEKYDRLVGEWLANGRRLPAAPTDDASMPTVADIMAEYWTWAKARYTPSESATIKAALKKMAKFYASLPAQDFGPKCLRIVRDEMIRAGWTRRQINRQVSRIRGLFRWAASHELLHESVYNQLATVESLKRGDAPERPRVKPVPRHLIRVVRPQPRDAPDGKAIAKGQRRSAKRPLEFADISRGYPRRSPGMPAV